MTAEPLRIGLVGAGGIAQTYAQVLRDSDFASVVGVADTRPAAAQALGEHLGCPTYVSHEKLAESTRPEAVIVCTPPVTHPEICCNLAARGIAVLCEKPLAIDSEGVRRMLIEAERGGVVLSMASKFRYVDDIVRAKSIVESGVLGEIVMVRNAFTSRVDMSQRWNSDVAVSGGGVLMDNGTHSVDILRYMFGALDEVCAVSARNIDSLPVEETALLLARTDSGVLASTELSWSVSPNLDSYIDIYASNGTVRVGWRESKYRPASSPDWIRFGSGYDKLDAFRREVSNFCRAVRWEEPLRITAEDALASALAIEAAYESLRDGGWVKVGATNLHSEPASRDGD